jgi:hypothetical protein
MVVTRTELSLTDVAREQNNRFDQKRYLAEKIFSNFISEFDEVKPLGQFTESIRNGQDFKTNFYSPIETEILYISVNQISSGILGKLYWDDITYLDISDDQIEVEAEIDDILITRSGSYPGIAWRATEEYLDDYRIVPSGFIQRLRLKNELDIEPEFIAAYLNSPPVKMLTQAFACGKEQLNISQDYITSIPVPILSEERRQTVIEGIEGYQMRIEQIQKLVQEMKIKQGDSIVDLLTNEGVEQIDLPDIPEMSVDSDSGTSQEWGLPTRRGQRESTFYVSN